MGCFRMHTMNGALVLDKPAGITSHDAVSAVRRLTRQRSIGHLGTLDPFATGVLVLLLGKATRLAQFYKLTKKSYSGVMRVGFATDTFDFTGTSCGPDRANDFQPEQLPGLMRQFVGTYLQRPPIYSAKKVDGIPAHRRVRKGQAVVLAPVPVTIHKLTLDYIKEQHVGFSVTVSSGTYIRSIVNDIGERLGIGAHLAELRRTAVGNFPIEQAVTLDELESGLRDGREMITPMNQLLPEIPSWKLPESDVQGALHGQFIQAAAFAASEAPFLRLMAPDGNLLAMAEKAGGPLYHPLVVLGDVPTNETEVMGEADAGPATDPVAEGG